MDEASELRDGYAEIGDQRLHYVEAGDGPLIVLLHGFPEFWYGWRLQIQPLAAAGFRVVAPDMRGYHLSSKPDSVKAYDLGQLTADIRGFIHERGAESGQRDRYLGEDLAEPDHDDVPSLDRVERLPERLALGPSRRGRAGQPAARRLFSARPGPATAAALPRKATRPGPSRRAPGAQRPAASGR